MSRGVPADPQHHQPAGPQSWDGPIQPPDLRVWTQTHSRGKWPERLSSNLVVVMCYVCCGIIQQSLLYAPPKSSSDAEEEEKECHGLLAALVVCVPGLVPPAVHQRGVHFLHPVVWFWIRQRKVHQVGHVSGPLAVPEHLYTAAPQGVSTPSSHFPKFNGDIVVPSGSKTSFCF